MNDLGIDSVGETGRIELGRCLRRCDELEARLRHALEEQLRIRQGLQSRLLEVQQAHQREVQLVVEKMEQEKQDLQHHLQESRGQMLTLQTEYQQASQILQSKLKNAATTITEQNLQVQNAETKITVLSQQLQDAEATNTAQSEQLVERKSDLKLFEDQLHHLQHQHDSILNELNGVYRSLSWRLTAPLRWLHRPFHGQSSQ